MKQIFPGFITEIFLTSAAISTRIERSNRLATVIMALHLPLHNRLDPMNKALHLADVRQLVLSGFSEILSVPLDIV